MFINFTNHPSKDWTNEQIAAAGEYGAILDIPFPEVDPNGDEDYIENLALNFTKQIIVYKPLAVLCQGEMTLAFAITAILISKFGVTVIAACSKRHSTEIVNANGTIAKRVEFKFTGFRKYSSNFYLTSKTADI